ncbi:MAG: baseplate J/gp47 family protein [Bryobacteraceae bacterium]
MPLIPPALDDRSYSDLVQDMLDSIPAHTPEWTIQQTGDPGRTLIELFAWLADSILYRANLIPERQRLAFLKLLGLPLHPAAAAAGILSVFSDPAVTTAVTLASGASIPGPPAFETLSELDVLPVTAQAYIKVPLTQAQQTTAMPLLQGLQSLYSMSNTPAGYTTTPVFANNTADPNGVDVYGGTIDQCIWFALMAGKPANLAAIRATLGGKNGQRILSLGLAPASASTDPFAAAGPQAAVPVTWQISATTAAGAPLIYHPLSVASDTTQGLSTAGVVQLMLPQSSDIGAPPNDVRSDAMAGVGPKPPRVDDPNIDSMLVAWIRVNVQSPLTLSWAGINAVAIDQRKTYNNVIAGVSDGSANQQFALAQTQIDPVTFQLDVDMPGLGFQLWTPVDDLSVLQGAVPAFVLDPEAGTVSFGNQMQGMIPPAGRRVRARLMRTGGGAAGNLPAGTLTAIQGVDVSGNSAKGLTVQQPIDTTNGADAETLNQAEQRIPATLRHQERAVTASDYKSIVLGMPGSGAARVEVLPLFKPQTRDTNVPGVVSVMVIPPKGDFHPPCPRAGRPLLENVYAYLNPKRPVAAEMYVIGTEYIGLGLSVAVEVTTGFGLLQVSQQVEQALRTYLWPVPPGGASGQGWPLGRTVRSLELEVIVSRVAGVEEVNGLLLFQSVTAGGFEQIEPDSAGNAELSLQSWQLPEVLQVLVTPGTDGSGVMPGSLSPVVQTDNTVAVPIVPAVC